MGDLGKSLLFSVFLFVTVAAVKDRQDSACENQIPSTCSLSSSLNTCEKLQDAGLCEEKWASSGLCGSTPGYVKDNCKLSCGICNGNVKITGTCAGTYDNGKSEITTLNYPESYPVSKQCNWNLEVPQGQHIELEFNDFRLEGDRGTCKYDYLQVYDGRSSSSRTINGKLCGNSKPSKIISSGNELFLDWTSDSSITLKGFEISATFREDLICCDPRIWPAPEGCDASCDSCQGYAKHGNACLNAPVCLNGGSCSCDKGPEEAKCFCFSGYTGDFCEIPPA